MSAEPKASATERLKPYRLKVDQFDRMIAAGIFPDRARIELLDGLLVVKRGVPKRRIAKTRSGLPLYKLSVDQIEEMSAAGILKESTRAELLGGVLIKQMTKYAPHNFGTDELAALLAAILPNDWIARQEKSVAIGPHWRPEPDIAVVRGPRARYRDVDPTQADIGLLIEVAESSYSETGASKVEPTPRPAFRFIGLSTSTRCGSKSSANPRARGSRQTIARKHISARKK